MVIVDYNRIPKEIKWRPFTPSRLCYANITRHHYKFMNDPDIIIRTDRLNKHRSNTEIQYGLYFTLNCDPNLRKRFSTNIEDVTGIEALKEEDLLIDLNAGGFKKLCPLVAYLEEAKAVDYNTTTIYLKDDGSIPVNDTILVSHIVVLKNKCIGINCRNRWTGLQRCNGSVYCYRCHSNNSLENHHFVFLSGYYHSLNTKHSLFNNLSYVLANRSEKKKLMANTGIQIICFFKYKANLPDEVMHHIYDFLTVIDNDIFDNLFELQCRITENTNIFFRGYNNTPLALKFILRNEESPENNGLLDSNTQNKLKYQHEVLTKKTKVPINKGLYNTRYQFKCMGFTEKGIELHDNRIELHKLNEKLYTEHLKLIKQEHNKRKRKL